MPKVHFLNEAKTIDAAKGKSLLELAQAADISVFKGFWKSYHCNGKGRCLGSGCKVWIKELEQGAVSPMSSWKEKWRWRLEGSQRLACQVTVTGECEIRTQPGALEFEEDTNWEPDARRYKWHDRLVVEKKKKKPKPAKKAKPKPEPAAEADPTAEAAPEPAAEAAPEPTVEAAPEPTVEAAPEPAAEAAPEPAVEAATATDTDTDTDTATDTDEAPAAAGKRRRAVPSDTDSGWE